VALVGVEFNSVHPGAAQSHRRTINRPERPKSVECLKVAVVDVEYNTIQDAHVRNRRQ
ncbi:unnamed protein product, partial [Rotaria magnacalcarata]